MTNCYNNASIYKLCCKDPKITDIYVGSTCAFRRRKAGHKHNCNNEKGNAYNHNVYKFIRDHGGFSNWEMIELLKYPCETKRELELKEREYLEMLGGTLNMTIPTRSIKESSKSYYEANKESKKEYYQAKKEEINERQLAYYNTHKEEINEKNREKFNCDCGGRFTKVNKIQHIKTNKHQKYLNSGFA
tara:strand:+ start:209 stop:772 length:564 start_codon:yes stop_codon:yes gene_type:complete